MVSQISEASLLTDALRVVEEAKNKGIVLRIMGALAVRIHTESLSTMHRKLARLGNGNAEFTDIDLITYRSQREASHRLLVSLGYKADRLVMAYFGENRFAYDHPEKQYHIDLFFEKLQFSHDIDLGKIGKGRLEIDYPTITVADLLLEKLQIHEINEKDIKDLIVLVRGHTLGEVNDNDAINMERLTSVMSEDWGFWYDAKANLEKVVDHCQVYLQQGLLRHEDILDITAKIGEIMNRINEAPKSSNWLKRAKEGTAKKWWKDVEEIFR